MKPKEQASEHTLIMLDVAKRMGIYVEESIKTLSPGTIEFAALNDQIELESAVLENPNTPAAQFFTAKVDKRLQSPRYLEANQQSKKLIDLLSGAVQKWLELGTTLHDFSKNPSFIRRSAIELIRGMINSV